MNILTTQTDQEVGVTARIEDPDTGDLFDPVACQCYILEPDETITTIVPEHPSVGVFRISKTLDKRGTYGVQFVTTDPDLTYGCNVTADYRNAWAP